MPDRPAPLPVNWEGSAAPNWYPHPVDHDCEECREQRKAGPQLAKPPIVRLMGEAKGRTKSELSPVVETTIKAENKRIRRERMARIALAMQGKRMRNKRAS